MAGADCRYVCCPFLETLLAQREFIPFELFKVNYAARKAGIQRHCTAREALAACPGKYA